MSEFKDIAGLIRDYFKSQDKVVAKPKDLKILDQQLKIIELEKMIKKLGGES